MSEDQPQGRSLFKKSDRLIAHIDRLSVGGRGVARYQGLVIFVANTAPDEDVEVELSFVKKNYAVGQLVRVIKDSPHRVNPICPVAGVCGGCSWQQVAYSEQLLQKESLVEESLVKFSGFTEIAAVLQATVPSPDEFRYRNRIQLHHRGSQLGFFKRGSHDIVDVNDCPITETVLAAEFPKLRRALASKPPGRIEIFINARAQAELSASAPIELETDEEDTSSSTGPAFSQVNTRQNEQLIARVIEIAETKLGGDSGATLIELYAGGGNFTFPLARALPKVKILASEINALSVRRGNETVARDFANRAIQFDCADVESWLNGWMKANSPSKSRSPFILLDPPRTGCGPRVMELLAQVKAQCLVYISCHPVTLARDLKTLAGNGYKLESVQPFDMFPQTDHVETIVVLSLEN